MKLDNDLFIETLHRKNTTTNKNQLIYHLITVHISLIIQHRHYGIPDNHRILDARKGPVKKTAAVKTLPKIQAGLPNSADSVLDKKNKNRLSLKKHSFDVKETRNGASTN